MSNEITASAQPRELSDEELYAVAGGTTFGDINGGINGSSIGDNSINIVVNCNPTIDFSPTVNSSVNIGYTPAPPSADFEADLSGV
jgi:hypothetical protein